MLVDTKSDRVKFDNKHKTKEEYKSVTCGCIEFIGSYRFLLVCIDELVKKIKY